MGSPERREHDRLPVRFAVRVCAAGSPPFEGVVENMGTLGALVSTTDLDAPFEAGDRVDLVVERPGIGDVETSGVVVRLEQEFVGGEIRRAFAVRFDEPLALEES